MRQRLCRRQSAEVAPCLPLPSRVGRAAPGNHVLILVRSNLQNPGQVHCGKGINPRRRLTAINGEVLIVFYRLLMTHSHPTTDFWAIDSAASGLGMKSRLHV
jgi:hypothetical protein